MIEENEEYNRINGLVADIQNGVCRRRSRIDKSYLVIYEW
jgi:hypothetical protein